MKIDLSGKNAVITGAANGIGLETANLFRQCGAQVIGIDLSVKENTEIDYMTCDITDCLACQKIFAEIVAKYGHIDILVNCAGITQDAITYKMSEEQFDRVTVSYTHLDVYKRQVLKSMPGSKEEYLMRPDLGILLDDKNMDIVRKQLKKNPDVQIVIGEGQSNQGLEKSMPELLPALLQGLDANKIDYGTPCFVEYTRVGIGDLIGQEVGAKVVCVVLGERPGLLSWDGLGCYITYNPKVGILESKRTCVSNIQDNGGTPPAEAGAYIADLITRILKEKKSGVDLII